MPYARDSAFLAALVLAGCAIDVELAAGEGTAQQLNGEGPVAPAELGSDPPGRFVNLAPPRTAPFERTGGVELSQPPPSGWSWHPVEGAQCRDGSQTGVFLRFTESARLLIVFEGGGVCTNAGFCAFNPGASDERIVGDFEAVTGLELGVAPGRQQPGVYSGGVPAGLFAVTRQENPFRDWNMAYLPNCTGDMHFGTRRSVRVSGMPAPQQLIGFLNTQRFVSRLASTFEGSLQHLVVAGSSFGAALNFSMISDAFEGVRSDLIVDSALPFSDEYLAPCQQDGWRELFGYDAALPPDCEECFQRGGGGLAQLIAFLQRKHADSRFALISSTRDEIVRLLLTSGEDDCTRFGNSSPALTLLGQQLGAPLYAAEKYEAGLLQLRSQHLASGRMATYFLAGLHATLHQHAIRPRFFDQPESGPSLAQFVTDFLAGDVYQYGP